MKGMGLMLGPTPEDESEPEGADVLAMKAFAKALKGSDSELQLEAFRELMTCCADADDDE